MSLMDVRLQAHKNSGNCTGPDCTHMSHGGDVKEKSRDHNETGIHPQFSFNGQKGSSLAGEYARHDKKDLSKSLHSQHLQQLKSMPNPKLQGLAKGGEVEDMDGDADADMDNEMMDMAAGELLSAIEKKDKKEILESIKALVLSCKG